MAMPDEALVYVVDDDQGMLESTVWLLESVGLKARPSPRAWTSSMPAGRPPCLRPARRADARHGRAERAGRTAGARHRPAGDLRQRPCRRAHRGARLQGRCGGFHRNPTTNNCCSTACSRPSIATPVGAGTTISTPGCANAWTASPARARRALAAGARLPPAAGGQQLEVRRPSTLPRAVMKRMQAQTLPELVGMAIAAGLVDPLRLRGAPERARAWRGAGKWHSFISHMVI